MTPAARIAAAIEILDEVIAGKAAEQVLTSWARKSRFAGSKDRAAVRDHVFDALRNLRSHACLGGGRGDAPTGRAVMIGSVRASGGDPADLFNGQGYGPSPLTAQETLDTYAQSDADLWNLPEWLVELFAADFGQDAQAVAMVLCNRAPVSLRVNKTKATLEQARIVLAETGVETRTNPLSPTALTVLEGARRVNNSPAYLDGLVELQDAASQAVVDNLKGVTGAKVLDFCAGGGGKSLAMAAAGAASVTAHDVSRDRMRDIPDRAARAGVRIDLSSKDALDPQGYDLVLVDVPCSGSGAWRRSPEAKWRLNREKLREITELQRDVLGQAAKFVAPGGSLAFVTCSVFRAENETQADWFEHAFSWTRLGQHRWGVTPDGDGFFLTQFKREL